MNVSENECGALYCSADCRFRYGLLHATVCPLAFIQHKRLQDNQKRLTNIKTTHSEVLFRVLQHPRVLNVVKDYRIDLSEESVPFLVKVKSN